VLLKEKRTGVNHEKTNFPTLGGKQWKGIENVGRRRFNEGGKRGAGPRTANPGMQGRILDGSLRDSKKREKKKKRLNGKRGRLAQQTESGELFCAAEKGWGKRQQRASVIGVFKILKEG